MQGRSARCSRSPTSVRALFPKLQRHGAGQGQPRSQRALHGAKPRAQRRPGERDFRGSDQDAGGRGHHSFGKLLAYAEKQAPLRRNVTTAEVGNVAAFLCSDLASGITGEITYVDAGFNTTGAGQIE